MPLDQKEKLITDEANAYLGKELNWRPLSGQVHTNELFSGQLHENKLVLRLNASSERAFGVSRFLERSVLELVSGYSWSPDVIHCSPERGWCLMKYHGSTVAELNVNENGEVQDFKSGKILAIRPDIHSQLVDALTDMQNLQEGPTFDYGALLNSYRKQVGAVYPLKQKLRKLEELFNYFKDTPLCLVHHDLHPGNLCWDQSLARLVIIDWEYAGIGNPWLDTALLLRYGLIQRDEISGLPCAKAYSESKVSDFLFQADQLNTILEELWTVVRAS